MLFKLLHRKVLIPVGIVLVVIILLMSVWTKSSELDQAEPLITFPAQGQDTISALTWGADSSILITGYSNGKLSIFPISDNGNHFSIISTPRTITSLAASPNNLLIGVGYENGIVEVWNIRDDVLLFEAKNHADWIHSLAWSPDGTLLASSSPDKTVIWDISTGEILTSLQGDMVSLVWAHNSILVGRGLNTLTYVWNISTKQLLSNIDAGVNIAVSSDGSKLAGMQGNRMMIWNLDDGKVLPDSNGRGGDTMRWNPDNTRIAIADGSLSNDYSVRIQDALTSKLELTLKGHTEPVFSLAWHPEKNYLISVSFDDTVRIWDITTGDIVRILKIEEINDASKSMLSPDLSKIAVVTGDESIAVWTLFP